MTHKYWLNVGFLNPYEYVGDSLIQSGWRIAYLDPKIKVLVTTDGHFNLLHSASDPDHRAMLAVTDSIRLLRSAIIEISGAEVWTQVRRGINHDG